MQCSRFTYLISECGVVLAPLWDDARRIWEQGSDFNVSIAKPKRLYRFSERYLPPMG